MKVILYGAHLCQDCLEAKARIATDAKIELDERDITASLRNLKEFLTYRDAGEQFSSVKRAGGIGIPFFVLEDGRTTFEISDFLSNADT